MKRRAFTLIELLTVIAIIAILAAMLVPVISIAEVRAKKAQAKLETQNIVNAIGAYEADYSRFPISSSANALGMEEITYGGTFQTPTGPWLVGSTNTVNNQVFTTNSDVIAILLDYTNYLNGYSPGVAPDNSATTTWTVNANHQSNPKRTVYLSSTKQVNWDPTMGGTPQPGIGNDLVYRDPWGNPYVITMDLDEDNFTSDAFYGGAKVSTTTGNAGDPGLYGLTYHTEGSSSSYAFHGNVMVWSAGPDGRIDPKSAANQGYNKDNVLSWQ